MLVKEAHKIHDYIDSYLGDKKGIAVNIGSSTSEFIDKSQPYIRSHVLNPLSKNFKIKNIDIKNQRGVDLVADFTTKNGQVLIKELKGNLYLISNLLEHIPDYSLGVNSIKNMLKKGDILILSGPNSFPYHPDPIDNKFRPSVKELTELFHQDFEIIDLRIVRSGTVLFSTALFQNPRSTGVVLRTKDSILKLLFSPKFVFRIVGNLFYPATAFCMFAVKK
jgi:hypothetical protein